jgi:coproporphyrinogen III oxidase-like Fe-S oxidoreductase
VGTGLYLHIPFCSAICPYCDFAVLTGGPRQRAAFVDSLLAEIALWRGDAERWGTFDSVYLGGGTPSALAPADLARLLAAVRAELPVTPDAWLGLEVNPEDVAAPTLTAWRDLGVTMLSLGVQSFDAATLRFLGRRHGPEQARQAVEMALAAGFPTVSIDLIYGESAEMPRQRSSPGADPVPGDAANSAGSTDEPGQAALVRWQRDLDAAVALAPDHLSCYQLTLHEGTPFGFRAARGALAELPQEDQAALFRLTHTFLAAHGYTGYEVSSFARHPGHESRHNRKYWDHTPYLGLGPSAHSFDGRRRWWNERKLHAYQAKLAGGERPVAGGEDLGPRDLALEEVMLALRTASGLDLAGFARRHGFDLAARNQEVIAGLAAGGLVLRSGERLIPTLDGLAVADSLARALRLDGP